MSSASPVQPEELRPAVAEDHAGRAQTAVDQTGLVQSRDGSDQRASHVQGLACRQARRGRVERRATRVLEDEVRARSSADVVDARQVGVGDARQRPSLGQPVRGQEADDDRAIEERIVSEKGSALRERPDEPELVELVAIDGHRAEDNTRAW